MAGDGQPDGGLAAVDLGRLGGGAVDLVLAGVGDLGLAGLGVLSGRGEGQQWVQARIEAYKGRKDFI